MKTKEVKIEWEDKEVTVVLKRLTFGARNDLIEKASKTEYISGKPKISLDMKKLREIGLTMGIHEAPFDVTLENIQKLDVTDGDLLYQELDELNTLQKKKNKTLDGLQNTEQATS